MRIRRSLDRRALHVVQHAANATHLLAAAGATRSAMHQRRERRAVSGGFLRAVAVHDQDASMVGSQPQHESARERIVRGEHRRDQAAAAAARERDRIRRIPVWQHGRDRVRMPPLRGRRARCGSRHSSSSGGTNAPRSRSAPCTSKSLQAARDEFCLAAQFRDRASTSARCSRLTSGPMRTPSHARIADDHLAQGGSASAAITSSDARGRHQRLANGRALLARLDRHLAHHLLDEEIEFRRAGPRIRRRECWSSRNRFPP